MAESRYTTGGTVQAQEGGLYLVRPADQQLMELCRQSRFAYVLTPRQLGKSSLMIRTAEELLAEGFRAVMVDLTQIGTGSDAEQWYGDVLEVVADQLELATNARAWWKQEAETGLTLRLTRFFEEVVLVEVSEPIVFFVDEIDTTLSLAFTDDFYAAIRYFYVARAQNTQLRRLSFVLIGVATPADLIRDPKRTPFNIGERVDLRDFTPAEAKPLAQGLPLPPPEAERALGWILGWTGGHPYLSQRLCSVLAEAPPLEWSEAAVDQAVGRTFFGERSEQDNNLQFVRDMLTKRAPEGYGAELLRTYRTIWRGKQSVADEEQNLVHSHLKLAGVVRREGRQLVVRNRLYQSVFNAAWIDEHNPEDFWKRYGPVLKWAVPVTVSAVVVAGVMTALALEARRQAAIATTREQVSRVMLRLPGDDAVAPAMLLAMDAWSRSQAISELVGPSSSALLEALQISQETNVWRGDKERISRLAFSPDGRVLATAGGEGVVRLWDSKSGLAVGTPIQIGMGNFLPMAFSPDGRVIASGGGDGAVRLWDAKSGRAIGTPLKAYRGSVGSLAFSPDGRMLVTGSWDEGMIRFWDMKSGEAVGPPRNLPGGGSATSLVFIPDGRLLASVGGSIWDVESGSPQFGTTKPMSNNDFQMMFWSITNSPDGSVIASGGDAFGGDDLDGGSLWLWDLKSGKAIGSPLKGHVGGLGLGALAFSPDGRLIASGGSDRTVRVWDVKSGKAIAPPFMGHKAVVNSVAFSPDGRVVASGGADGMVRLWDKKIGAEIAPPLKAHKGKVRSLAFLHSNSNGLLVSGEEDGLRAWNLKGGSVIAELSVPEAVQRVPEVFFYSYWLRSERSLRVTATSGRAAVSPDGRVIAVAKDDGSVILSDSESGKPIGTPLKGDHLGNI